MLAGMAKKKAQEKPKKKPVGPVTAALLLSQMHADEAQRKPDGREVSEKQRKLIKEKQREAALQLWAPGGRLRKMQKERKKQQQQRRKLA